MKPTFTGAVTGTVPQGAIKLLSAVVDMCESPATDDETMAEMASDIKRFLSENGTPYVDPYDRWLKSQEPTPADRQGFEPFEYTERS